MDYDSLESSNASFVVRRTVDPDVRLHRDLDALKDSLRRAYPVAPVVEDVDPKFMLLLERLADLNLGRRR
jgi:hypothetical protein